MPLLNTIKNSLSFRYQYWLKQKQAKRLARAVELHKKKVKSIETDDFSIISANCWGGSVYEDLSLPYQSPTIGLFFYAPCFMMLLEDLKATINLPLSFVEKSKYRGANTYREQNYKYPLGKLGDHIEIQFLHYNSEEEAKAKWDRRKQRINWDNLYIACTDRDGMTPDLMKTFDSLPYNNKVIFTGQPYKRVKSAQFLRAFKKDNVVGDLYNQRYYVTRDFNLKQWLENDI